MSLSLLGMSSEKGRKRSSSIGDIVIACVCRWRESRHFRKKI